MDFVKMIADIATTHITSFRFNFYLQLVKIDSYLSMRSTLFKKIIFLLKQIKLTAKLRCSNNYNFSN